MLHDPDGRFYELQAGDFLGAKIHASGKLPHDSEITEAILLLEYGVVDHQRKGEKRIIDAFIVRGPAGRPLDETGCSRLEFWGVQSVSKG